ncbi:MAG: hypothetical protein ACI4BD_05510 [Paludibacteraceae bacterium]
MKQDMDISILGTFEDNWVTQEWLPKHPEDEALMRAVWAEIADLWWNKLPIHFEYYAENKSGLRVMSEITLFDREQVQSMLLLEKQQLAYFAEFYPDKSAYKKAVFEQLPDCYWGQMIQAHDLELNELMARYLTKIKVNKRIRTKRRDVMLDAAVSFDAMYAYCFTNLREYDYDRQKEMLEEFGCLRLLMWDVYSEHFRNKNTESGAWSLPELDTISKEIAYRLEKRGFSFECSWQERINICLLKCYGRRL